MLTTCSSTESGEYCGCLSSSVRRSPRASWRWGVTSRSEPDFAKAAISRYWASSPLIGPAAQKQGHLAVGDDLLGEVVVDDHGVHAVVAEPLAHGATRERRQELQRGRLGRRGRDDDRVVERAALLERLDDLGDRRALLADGDVDAVELGALVRAGVDRLLVQDGVDGDRGLAGLAVADDQLALAAADRDQGVDGL